MKLLIVEDNVESAQLLVRLFQSQGYEVMHKTHGLDGLRAAREQAFDAILLDFNLPDIDGSQVGLLLRSMFKDIPLIALTAQSDRVTQNKAKVFGFSAFIPKPWSVVELMKVLDDLLADRKRKADEHLTIIEHKLNTQDIKIFKSVGGPPSDE